MIGRTLFRYISWHFTKALVAMMLLLLFLIVTVEFIEGLRRIDDSLNVSMGQIYLAALFTAPFFIEKAFPFACLFAAMITLFQLNQKMELVVARAAGVSVWQFLMPISTVAVVIGVFAATVYNPLAISFYEKSLDMKAELFGKSSRSSIKSGSDLWLRQDDGIVGNTVINAKLSRKGGTLLDGVKMIRFDPGGDVYERIEAETAIHRGNEWLLIDVSVSDAEQKVRRVESVIVPTNLSKEYLLGAIGDADSVDFWGLRKAAETVRLSGLNHLPYLVQFQSLLALPFLLLAMVLIASTVSLKFVRSGQAGRLVLGGIMGGFVLYAATRVVTSLGNNGIVPPSVAVWSPSLVAILFGMSVLLYQEDG
jgi:lipopolysaccharide export system permease protein